MNEHIRRRLDPVFRAADDQLKIIEKAMEPLSRYSQEVTSGGRFDVATREAIHAAAEAVTTLFNILTAAFRDIALLDYEAAQLVLDEGGVPALTGPTNLGNE